jgi:hypothetical protein
MRRSPCNRHKRERKKRRKIKVIKARKIMLKKHNVK